MSNLQPQVEEANNSSLALLILSSVLWGGSFVSVKIGLEYINAYDFAFLRLASAAFVLLAVLGIQRKFELTALKEPSVWALGLLNGVGFTLQFVGLLYTTAAKTALLVDLNVVVIAILSWRAFGESFGVRKKLGVIVGVIGALLITTNGDLSTLAQGELRGDLLVFVAGLVWAVFIVFHKRVQMRRQRNVIEMSATVMLVTALSLLPMALLLGGLNLRAIVAQGWEWVAISALVCTVLPYALWVAALKAVTATIASVVGMLEVVCAMVLSTLLLGERYTAVTLLGAILVLGSILAVAES
jgi:drug/metabolite transporter (DMT)-like permease